MIPFPFRSFCNAKPVVVEMGPNGNLFYLAKAPDDGVERFPAFQNFKGGLLLEADWDSNIVWQHEDPNHHHYARHTDSGGAIYLTVETMPADLAARVKGGIPGSEIADMWADRIVEVDSAGQLVWLGSGSGQAFSLKRGQGGGQVHQKHDRALATNPKPVSDAGPIMSVLREAW